MRTISKIIKGGYVIRLNALEFNQHISHCESHLDYCSNHIFEVGDVLRLECYSVDSDTFAGCYIFRFITAVSNRYALLSDDTVCRLWLSPFKPAL